VGASSVSSLIAQVRTHVGDEEQRRFNTATIVQYLSFAQRRVAEMFGKIGDSGWFEKELSNVALPMNTEFIDLPADFGGVKLLETIGTDGLRTVLVPLRRDQISQARSASTPAGTMGVTPGYYLRRSGGATITSQLGVAPIVPWDRTLNLIYRQTLAALPPDGSGLMSLDTIFDEVCALRAAMACLGDTETSDTTWSRTLGELIAVLANAQQGSQDEGNTEQVGNVMHSQWEWGY